MRQFDSDSSASEFEFTSLEMDLRSRQLLLTRPDSNTVSLRLPADFFPMQDGFVRVILNHSADLLTFETQSGDLVVFELPSAKPNERHRDRPIVYLDQNHWSSLFKAAYEPKRIRQESELDAARSVLERARSGEVILPMSAGHMAETSGWTNQERRYQLALTILKTSAGWQMRHPLDIRMHELTETLLARYGSIGPTSLEVFTLEPNAVHSKQARSGFRPVDASLPREAAIAATILTAASVNLAVMLDSESIPAGDDSGWTDHIQRFTDWLAGEPRETHVHRERTYAWFISDLRNELAEAASHSGISPEDLGSWLSHHGGDDIDAMPSLGLFREALHQKLSNRRTVWERNDLVDLMYLSCATGYADHTVGERSMVAQIRQGAKRIGRTVSIHRSLAALVDHLDDSRPS